MPKLPLTIFTCTNCGAQYQKWVGRCLECGKWGTVEASRTKEKGERNKLTLTTAAIKMERLHERKTKEISRIRTGIGELDRVLGGGMVPGSLILLGGEPGIGKSTLSLQLATSIPNTIYVSGEESAEQIRLRAERLALTEKDMHLANATNVESMIATIQEQKPALAVIDSIQTIYTEQAEGEPGSVSQVRACTVLLLACAKTTNTAIVLIGHVTKDGSVAGPRTLEHLVDTVLYFEGDRYHHLRLLRGVKNRFGSTDEIGMFDMTERGLTEVTNPSALLLEERGETMPGSVVTCLLEGTRPLLVEVQALVNKTTFGYPVRKASGFDLNRLHVPIAVLQKRAGVNLAQYDVHVNIVGGVKANEPATDLAVCLAIASAYKDKTLGNDLAVFGEVGLGGEIRSVRLLDKRLKECAALGMKRVITKSTPGKTPAEDNLKIISVKNIQELITHA